MTCGCFAGGVWRTASAQNCCPIHRVGPTKDSGLSSSREVRPVTERGTATWRMVAGLLVLVTLAGFCLLLVKPYYRNWQLQQFVEQVAFDQNRHHQPPDLAVAEIADHASRLGLPVSVDQIKVTRTEAGTFIELRYFVRVDLLVYTVDLHFRPSAGVR